MEPQGQSIEKGLAGNPGGTGKPDLVLDTATELNFARTRNSYEQTMMSWIRTATSLITFGFSIYKFFQIEGPAAHTVRNYLIGPHEFSLMLVSIGMISLVLSTFDYRRSIGLPAIPRRQSLACDRGCRLDVRTGHSCAACDDFPPIMTKMPVA